MSKLPPEVRSQVAELTLTPDRPLLITDADEVLFAFVRGFEGYLNTQGFILRLDSFALSGNVRRQDTDEALPAPQVRDLIEAFFDTCTELLEPVAGAAVALAELSQRAQILVLSNVPLPQRAARQRALQRHAMDYPLIANIGRKGSAVAMLADSIDAPVFFIDDIPHNITSVAESAAHVTRLHFVADPRLARLLGPAEDAHARIDDWPTARAFIEDRLSEQGF